MKRSVILLASSALTVLTLGSVTPAQAQWAKDRTYYGEFPAQSLSDFFTTISTNPTGTVTLNSACQNTNPNGPGYYTSGSYNNSVYQDYVWTGDPTQPRSTLFAYTPEESDGSTNYYSGAASSNTTHTSGYTDVPYAMTYDSRASTAGFAIVPAPNDTTTTTETTSCTLVLSTHTDASSRECHSNSHSHSDIR